MRSSPARRRFFSRGFATLAAILTCGCGDVVDCLVDNLLPDLIGGFRAEPDIVFFGHEAVLSWDVWDHGLCDIEPEVGGLTEDHGSVRVAPTLTTTYTLACREEDSSADDEICGPRSQNRRVTVTVTLPQP